MERANAQDVYALLQTLGMSFTHTAHAEAHTMEDLVQVEETLGAPFCKNLFLTNRQKTEFILLLIRGDKRFRTAEVSRRLGRSRLSLARKIPCLNCWVCIPAPSPLWAWCLTPRTR